MWRGMMKRLDAGVAWAAIPLRHSGQGAMSDGRLSSVKIEDEHMNSNNTALIFARRHIEFPFTGDSGSKIRTEIFMSLED
jgi:hypothetical protein